MLVNRKNRDRIVKFYISAKLFKYPHFYDWSDVYRDIDDTNMTKFVRKSKDEISKMSVDEFCAYMEELDNSSVCNWSTRHQQCLICHNLIKRRGARIFRAISFDEFEQNELRFNQFFFVILQRKK